MFETVSDALLDPPSIRAMGYVARCKANGVKRISVVTTIGAGDSMDQAPWAFRLLMMTVMSSIMADKNKQESLFLSGHTRSDPQAPS